MLLEGNFFASLQAAQIVLSTHVSLFHGSCMSGLLALMASGTQGQDMIATSTETALCAQMHLVAVNIKLGLVNVWLTEGEYMTGRFINFVLPNCLPPCFFLPALLKSFAVPTRLWT